MIIKISVLLRQDRRGLFEWRWTFFWADFTEKHENMKKALEMVWWPRPLVVAATGESHAPVGTAAEANGESPAYRKRLRGTAASSLSDLAPKALKRPYFRPK
jgi:hypothetical protein